MAFYGQVPLPPPREMFGPRRPWGPMEYAMDLAQGYDLPPLPPPRREYDRARPPPRMSMEYDMPPRRFDRDRPPRGHRGRNEKEVITREYLEYPDGEVIEIPPGSYGGERPPRSPRRRSRMPSPPPRRRARSYDRFLDDIEASRYDRYPRDRPLPPPRARDFPPRGRNDRTEMDYTFGGRPAYMDAREDKYQVTSKRIGGGYDHRGCRATTYPKGY